MPSHDLRSEIKALLVAELNLSRYARDPGSIADDAPLFRAAEAAAAANAAGPGVNGAWGLGLDSLDALQIAMLVEERFGVRVPEGDEARAVFRSVATLAAFIEEQRASGSPPSGRGREQP